MFKILIADDEPIVRLGFKSLLNWEEHNMEISFEASNGKQALELIKAHRDIDLLITDINMPLMDGLELIEEVEKLENPPSVVVLSAYDDYDLVRRAFKLGIRDYILKFKMNSSDILSLLNRIFSSMEEKKDSAPSPQNIKRARRDFYRNIMLGTARADKIESGLTLGIDLENSPVYVCALVLDDFTLLKNRYRKGDMAEVLGSVRNSMEQVLPEGGEVIAHSPEEYTVILPYRETRPEQVSNTLNRIRQNLNNYLNIDMTAGVSPMGDSLEDLPTLYKAARQNASLRYILGKGHDIFPGDNSRIRHTPHVDIYPMVRELFHFFDKCESEETFKRLDEILELIEHFEALTLKDLLPEYSKLLILLNNHLIDGGMDPDHYMETPLYTLLHNFETSEEIHIWIRNYTDKIMKGAEEKRSKISPVIREAKGYIEDNYMDKMLLDSMCKYLKINKSYFSTLFAQEMKVSFSGYLTHIRIEHAKELLETTGMRVYELCDEVGYSNTEHFSRVFKKETGFSPSQYRNTYYRD